MAQYQLCIVRTCPHQYRRKVRVCGFHRFPEEEDELAFSFWLDAVGLTLSAFHRTPRTMRYVCSCHFNKDDFEPYSGRRQIKNYAIPNLLLPETFEKPVVDKSKTASHVPLILRRKGAKPLTPKNAIHIPSTVLGDAMKPATPSVEDDSDPEHTANSVPLIQQKTGTTSLAHEQVACSPALTQDVATKSRKKRRKQKFIYADIPCMTDDSPEFDELGLPESDSSEDSLHLDVRSPASWISANYNGTQQLVVRDTVSTTDASSQMAKFQGSPDCNSDVSQLAATPAVVQSHGTPMTLRFRKDRRKQQLKPKEHSCITDAPSPVSLMSSSLNGTPHLVIRDLFCTMNTSPQFQAPEPTETRKHRRKQQLTPKDQSCVTDGRNPVSWMPANANGTFVIRDIFCTMGTSPQITNFKAGTDCSSDVGRLTAAPSAATSRELPPTSRSGKRGKKQPLRTKDSPRTKDEFEAQASGESLQVESLYEVHLPPSPGKYRIRECDEKGSSAEETVKRLEEEAAALREQIVALKSGFYALFGEYDVNVVIQCQATNSWSEASIQKAEYIMKFCGWIGYNTLREMRFPLPSERELLLWTKLMAYKES